MADALVIDGITMRRAGRDILRDVSVAAGSGLVVVTGGNGSGKSTLLAAICGIVPLVSGHIAIAGHDLVADAVAAKRALGLMPERTDAFIGLTGRTWLAFVAGVRGADLAPTLVWLEPLFAAEALDRRMSSLSAGQRRKIALAAAICGEPPVLLLDEPTNALDAAGLAALDAIVTTWCAAGRTVVCAMHQPCPWADLATVRWHVAGATVVETQVVRSNCGP